MSETTAIEWCDATLNLWWGCTKVSDGCKNCYAAHLADDRYKKGNWGPKGDREEKKSWRSILNKIVKQAKTSERRLRVFCSSMSDVFEGPETLGGLESENWKTVDRLQFQLFRAIEDHPEIDFLILTKRPENVNARCRNYGFSCDGSLPPNIWIGTSIEDQKTADERIPELLKIPAKVRFLSVEPLLGPVDLSYTCWNGADSLGSMPGIHWVICGGESGPNARPMHPDWARDVRDQCATANVPFLFKQWGEWCPGEAWDGWKENGRYTEARYSNGEWLINLLVPANPDQHVDDEADVYRIGKSRAGRTLDGRIHNEFPRRKHDSALL